MTHNNRILSPEIIDLPRFDPKIALGVMASGKGSNFDALIKYSKLDFDAEIKCLIVNNHKSGAIDIAKTHNIPFIVLDHKAYKSREELDLEIIKVFSKYNIDIIVMAGWMRIVTPILINKYSKRIVNIHPSLLPMFKGSDAIQDALNQGVKITGCTAHIVEEEVDSGEILIQAAVNIDETDNKESLRKKIQHVEHKILYKGIALAAMSIRNI